MSRGKAYKKAVRDEILETFCESSEDTDYGDQTTMNSPNDDLMGTPMDYEKEKPNRLPMFGLNKLQDMTQLSTDIFHSDMFCKQDAKLQDLTEIPKICNDKFPRFAMEKS